MTPITNARAFTVFGLFSLALATLSGCVLYEQGQGLKALETHLESRLDSTLLKAPASAGLEIDKRVSHLLTEPLTVSTAVEVAFLRNPELRALLANLGIAEAELLKASQIPNPFFEMEARFLPRQAPSLELSFVQNFVGVLLRPNTRQLASKALEATTLQVTAELLDLAADVQRAFYDFQGRAEARSLWSTVFESTRASYDIAQRMHAAGNLTHRDLLAYQAQQEEAKLSLAQAESAVAASKEDLNERLGLWGEETTWRAAERLPEPPHEPLLSTDLERHAIERSLDLALAKTERELTFSALSLSRPLSLFMGTDLGIGLERDPGESWLSGPRVAFPVPFFDQGQADYERALSLFTQKDSLYAKTAITVRSRIRAAAAALEAKRQRALYYQEVLVPLRTALRYETQKEYNAMLIGVFDLLRAKEEEIRAGVEYVDSLRAYWLARVRFDLLQNGRLSEDDPNDEATPIRTTDSANGDHA